MGSSVAASVAAGGHSVTWASERRSEATRERAEKADIEDVGTLRALCERCEILLSVCPPHAAEDVADSMLELGFRGLYVDANAISPEKTRRIGMRVAAAGATFIDGGIVGGPAWEPGTWLYLSGPKTSAERVAALFEDGPLDAALIDEEIGTASALKMCYAAYTKGTTALLSNILAAAEAFGVREALEDQWSRDWPDFADRTQSRVRRVTRKAWRFRGEMDEIAETFRAVGLPGEFHEGAGEVYRRLDGLEACEELPPLDTVLRRLVEPGE